MELIGAKSLWMDAELTVYAVFGMSSWCMRDFQQDRVCSVWDEQLVHEGQACCTVVLGLGVAEFSGFRCFFAGVADVGSGHVSFRIS